jgi:DNA-directed RNA polymerase subunit beta
VKVLKEDDTEVEIRENIEYGETDLNTIIEGEQQKERVEEPLSQHGFTEQEFADGELVDVEDHKPSDTYTDAEENFDEE